MCWTVSVRPGPGSSSASTDAPQLVQPHVRLLAMTRRRPVDPIEDRRDLQDLSPCFQEIVIENLQRNRAC